MMVSKVRGKFTKFAGELTTAENLLDSSVTAEIDLASIETGSEQRDGHLRSPDFFDTENHPLMTYRSTSVRADGGDWVLDGELTLKGVTRTVPLKLEVNGFGPDAYGGTRAGFTATGQINRADFGVTWNAAIEGGGVVVADKVDLHLEIETVLKA
jgi:polyisoprenoid-binding protein YceI